MKETPVPEQLRHFELKSRPEDFHQLLAHAKLVIGESATVCSEAAMLGVPSIYLSNANRGYIDELSERYGLVFKAACQNNSLLNALNDIESGKVQRRLQDCHRTMMEEISDVTQVIVRTIELVGSDSINTESMIGNQLLSLPSSFQNSLDSYAKREFH